MVAFRLRGDVDGMLVLLKKLLPEIITLSSTDLFSKIN